MIKKTTCSVILLSVLTLSPTLSMALVNDTKRIVTLCKQRWPADRVVQTFCKEENLNYQNWLEHIQKRLPMNTEERLEINQCLSKYAPDYRKAYDCYF